MIIEMINSTREKPLDDLNVAGFGIA